MVLFFIIIIKKFIIMTFREYRFSQKSSFACTKYLIMQFFLWLRIQTNPSRYKSKSFSTLASFVYFINAWSIVGPFYGLYIFFRFLRFSIGKLTSDRRTPKFGIYSRKRLQKILI